MLNSDNANMQQIMLPRSSKLEKPKVGKPKVADDILAYPKVCGTPVAHRSSTIAVEKQYFGQIGHYQMIFLR